MSKTFQKGVSESAVKLDGSGLRIAIVHTRWNYALVDQMYKVVRESLINKHGVLPENIYTVSCLLGYIRSLYSYAKPARRRSLARTSCLWLPSS